jgi:hypothetical protein
LSWLTFAPGRSGYEDYSELLDGINIPPNKLKEMLHRENDLRLCANSQALYRTAIEKDGFEGFIQVTENIQKQV